MIKTSIPQISSISPAEKLALIGELWENIESHADEIPARDWQKAELDRRLKDYKRNPTDGQPWAVVKEKIKRSL